jgi:hypothetical protein
MRLQKVFVLLFMVANKLAVEKRMTWDGNQWVQGYKDGKRQPGSTAAFRAD